MPDAGALLETLSGGASLSESDAGAVAEAIAEALGPAAAARIYSGSLAASGGEVYAAAKGTGSERLVLAASRGPTGGRAGAKLGEFALAKVQLGPDLKKLVEDAVESTAQDLAKP